MKLPSHAAPSLTLSSPPSSPQTITFPNTPNYLDPLSMSLDGSNSSDSETEYAESLHSLTPSMAEQLFTTSFTGHRYSALNRDYAQSFDEPAKQAEKSTERFVSAIAGGEGKLWWEPEGKEGLIDELLGSGRVPNPRVLDVGCGIAGVWISAVASSYPRTEVVGLDLVPVEGLLPPNVTLEVWDYTEGLPFPDGYFRLVHVRHALYFMAHAFNHLITTEVRRVLAPGGVLLIEESDAELYNAERDSSTLPWSRFEPKDEIRLERIVFKTIRTLLESCPEDPYNPLLNHRAFSQVYSQDWNVHVGWRDGKKGEPSSTETGNHIACILAREAYIKLVQNQQPPPRQVDGEASNEERRLREIERFLTSSQTGVYVGFKTFLAVRAQNSVYIDS